MRLKKLAIGFGIFCMMMSTSKVQAASCNDYFKEIAVVHLNQESASMYRGATFYSEKIEELSSGEILSLRGTVIGDVKENGQFEVWYEVSDEEGHIGYVYQEDAAIQYEAQKELVNAGMVLASANEDMEVSVEESAAAVNEDHVDLNMEESYTVKELQGNEVTVAVEETSASVDASSVTLSVKPMDEYTREQLVSYAMSFLGNPYRYGGTSLTEGTDCSGFTMGVFAKFGMELPHSSYSQRSYGTQVSAADAQAGDLVCYSGHVAIYIGDGQIVHAANSQMGICISDVNYSPVLCYRRLLD